MKIFFNANIITMAEDMIHYNAMSVENGRIVELFNQKPDIDGDYVDLKGSWVLPGFIDTHTHCVSGGIYSMGVSLESCEDLCELKERLKAGNKLDNMIFAWHLDENELLEKRFPTAKEVDELFPETAVLIRRVDGHSCVINSYAAKQIEAVQPLDSNFNGYFRGSINDKIVNWFHRNLSENSILKAYEKAAWHAVKYGHTTVHTMVGNGHDSIEHFELLKQNMDRFPIEFILYAQCFNLEEAISAKADRIGGCILADGSFGSHTAALNEPYHDQPDEYGRLYHDDEFWEKFITSAHKNDLQVAVHCIGDRAISQILKFYKKAQLDSPKDLRHILIHNELTSDDMISDMAEAKVTAAMQPMFDRLWAGKDGLYERVLGKERTRSTNRLRSITDAGVIIGGGSDWYVTEMDALAEINAAVNIHNPAERLTPFEAIKLYTSNAAFLSHDEHRIGKLLPGMQADMVVLNENPLAAENIADIRIERVFKLGERLDT